MRTFKYLFFTAFSIFLLNLKLSAQTPEKWYRIGPWGGDIRAIKMKLVDSSLKVTGGARPGNDSVVVASYGNGIFITDSIGGTGGGNWFQRNNGIPTRKVLSLGMRRIGYGDTMFVGLEGYGLFRTYNGGLSWETACSSGTPNLSTLSIFAIAIHPNESRKIFVATNLGLLKSDNYGATWSQMPTVPSTSKVTDVVITPSQNVYASCGRTLYRSLDEGTTWSSTTFTTDSSTINCLAAADATSDTVFCGFNDGVVLEVTWPTYRTIENSAGLAGYAIYDIALNPSIDQNIIASEGYIKITGSSDTMYLATKNGFWKGIKPQLPLAQNYNWTQVNTGLTGPPYGSGSTATQCVEFYRSRISSTKYGDWVFTGTKFNGIFATENKPGGGVSWMAANNSLPTGGLKTLMINPMNSDIVFAGGGYYLNNGVSNGNGSLWRCVNASSTTTPTWIRVLPTVDSVTQGHVITSIASSYVDNNVYWVTDSLRGLYKSVDQGLTWSLIYPGTPTAGINYVHNFKTYNSYPASSSSETLFLSRQYNTTKWGLYKSTNGGTSFSIVDTFSYKITSITSEDSTSPQNVYLTTWGGGVYKSTNNGSTFSRTPAGGNPYVYSLSVDSAASYLVAGTQYGILKSTDRGGLWQNDDVGDITYSPDSSYSVFTFRDTLRAVLSTKGIYHRTKHGINTWRRDTLDIDGTNAVPSPHDTLMMRDVKTIWKWARTWPTPNISYAVSEIHSVFRRKAHYGMTLPIMNSPTAIQAGTIYTYIPDTCSGIRGSLVDIPVRVINASYADSFRVSIHIPKDYLDLGTKTDGIDTTVLSGTLANGRSFTREVDQNDVGVCRWIFNSTTALGTNNDTVLFRVRYRLATTNSLNDSLPANSTSTAQKNYDSSIHLLGAELSGTTNGEDSTDFLFTPSWDRNITYFGTSSGIDSSAIFWLRKLPVDNVTDNGLPGTLVFEVEDDYRGLPGKQGNSSVFQNWNLKTDKDWNYVRNTGSDMTIFIKPSANPTYPYLTWPGLPERSIRTGDMIGAFFYRNDELVCAGYGTWIADSGCAFSISGRSQNTTYKDGFADGDGLNFKIYDSRYKKVWSVPGMFTRPVGDSAIFRSGRYLVFDTMFQGKQVLNMYVDGRGPDNITSPSRGGWHLISSYLHPNDPGSAVSQIFNTILNFYILKDANTGYVYWPSLKLDQILYWDVKKAYWVYMLKDGYNTLRYPEFANSGTSMCLFKGAKIDPSRNSISLSLGWNWIPFFGNSPYSIVSGLSSISGKFMLVKDDSGAIYWPGAVNMIGNLQPGKGYGIYMTSTGTLVYPQAVISSFKNQIYSYGFGVPVLGDDSRNEKYFKVNRIGPNSQILKIKLTNYNLDDGDEVGIFNSSGKCIGSSKYIKNQKNLLFITVFGLDELAEDEKDMGAGENEELSIKIFRYNEKKEINPKLYKITPENSETNKILYSTNTIINLNLSLNENNIPLSYALMQNYPNPFNSSTQIKYSIPEEGIVKIKIYDILGREVKEIMNEKRFPNYYIEEWNGLDKNGKKATTGVYFCTIEVNQFRKNIKMMLLK